MTAKKSLGQKNHEMATDLHGKISRNCEQGVAKGIKKVHELIDAHYASEKPGLYLKIIVPIIREYVDDPVSEWLRKFEAQPIVLSSLLEEIGSECAAMVERMAESVASRDPIGYSFTYPDLNHTADSIINFCSYCLFHKSDSTQVLRVEPDPHDERVLLVNSARSKKSGGSTQRMAKLGIPPRIDFTVMNDENAYCQLCTDLTMHTRELKRLLFSPSSDGQISEADRKKIAITNLRVVIPGYSQHYCSKHNPDDVPATAYNKARGLRKTYYSMRRFIILARHARGLAVPYWHVVRPLSYLIPDLCVDRSLIKQVPMLVDKWHEMDEDDGHRGGVDDEILALFDAIVQSFADTQHHLKDLIAALAIGRSAEVYDLAKELNVLPDDIEHLIDSGFIHCSRRESIRRGDTWIGNFDS